MSIIRNLLYNGASIDALYDSGLLYNQKLIYNFILQHQPKYILHCGCPTNALGLAYYIKEHYPYPCEILHIKNWLSTPQDWLLSNSENLNPHKAFLDKIIENRLDDVLASFNGTSKTAYEILKSRNFQFNMMVSDTIDNNIDYTDFLELLTKNPLHIRYIGLKKINDIISEPIFKTHLDIPFACAQGYLIMGMDYLSLYEEQSSMANLLTDKSIQTNKNEITDNDSKHHHTDYNDAHTNNDTIDSTQTETETEIEIETENQSDDENQTLSPKEARELRRQERRQAREERYQQRITDQNNPEETLIDNNNNHTNNTINISTNNSNPYPLRIDNNGESTLSAARRALRARRLERRMNAQNN